MYCIDGIRVLAAFMARAMMPIAVAVTLAACQSVPPSGPSPAQRAVLAAHGFVQTERGWELTMADRLLFDSDESRLKPAQIDAIARIGSELVRVGVAAARVEGHTDATGSTAHNTQLSLERANAVAGPLRQSGMALSDDQILGRGEAFPIGDNRSAEGRADNRRVVIIVTP
jgi:outer membrane protein OmpA-like peptidoglycan-associated protein